MKIRNATSADLPTLMGIYERARKWMAESDNPTQRGTSYPSKEQVLQDITEGHYYVCEKEGKILGAFVFLQREESDYLHIQDGQWLNDAPYGVVHTIAVSDQGKGVATFCLERCFQQCGNIRIDTHRNNIAMQKCLEKNGYTYCGIIHYDHPLIEDPERIAFQKIHNFTPHQKLVYEALLKIPKGKVTTYGALGKHLGLHPRYVGKLLSQNPSPDVYPCFKVVAYDGALCGFALGLEDKIKRLKAEGIKIVKRKVPTEYFYYFV